MSPIDLSPVLKNYEGKWVALSNDNKTIFGSGNSPKVAADQAKSNGNEEYTILFVESSDLLYCG